jgi:hypothetical protein
MNEAATQLNDRLYTAVSNWNRNLAYKQATLIEPDWYIWEDQRFCEPGVTEPQANKDQGSVAFFYPNGVDTLDDSYTLPEPRDGGLGGWDTLGTISSADCASDEDLASSILYTFCELALDLKDHPDDIDGINAQMANDGDSTFDAVLLDDGNVAITSIEQNYRKLFHMKSKWNLALARLVTNNLRWN